jgi:hypothetical protein
MIIHVGTLGFIQGNRSKGLLDVNLGNAEAASSHPAEPLAAVSSGQVCVSVFFINPDSLK